MASLRTALIRAGLEALYFSGSHRVLQPFFGGLGAILTLHHVRPARAEAFQPNRLLEITPDFLEEVVVRLRRAEIDLVSLDAVCERLTQGAAGRRFVCFTFDDGYRDNRDFAYPILARHGVPFAVFVATSFPERLGELWWIALERVIAGAESVSVTVAGEDLAFRTRTTREKARAFQRIYWRLRALPSNAALRATMQELCGRHGIDLASLCAELCMSWDEIRALAADPLVTIGAHTVSHPLLAKSTREEVRREMGASVEALAAELGRRPHHFAYPVGDETAAGPREFAIAAELGFTTALTTRPGVLTAQHRGRLLALPRISLNGEFQRARYLSVLLSGAPTALWGGLRGWTGATTRPGPGSVEVGSPAIS